LKCRMKPVFRLTLLIFLMLVVLITGGFTDDRIRLHYNERPPYLITVAEGIVAGLTATPSSLAFQSAGIPFVWRNTPSKRQMHILEQNEGRDCLVGWFKNSERETFAKYTKPIYRDKPTIGLALFNNSKIATGWTLKDVLANKNIRLLTKNGYSYGKFIDNIIVDLRPNRLNVTAENTKMIRMLSADRADFMFMAEEEVDGVLKSANMLRSDFKTVNFLDTPPGSYRYILCSMKVEDYIIEKLNHWIKPIDQGTSPK